VTKKSDAWMPLYVGDYMADTSHLTCEQHGAYLLILMALWKRAGAGLPDVDENMAAAARLPVSRWKAIRPILLDGVLLRTDGQTVTQKRLDAEIGKAQGITEARAAAGAKGGATAQANRKQTGEANDEQTGKANGKQTSTPSPSPSPREENPPTPRGGSDGGVHDFPPGFDALWSLYPRKVAKTAAAKAFARLRPDEALQARIAAAVRAQSESPEWRKDRGAFVPHLATWLNGRRWEDDTSASSGPDIFAGAV